MMNTRLKNVCQHWLIGGGSTTFSAVVLSRYRRCFYYFISFPRNTVVIARYMHVHTMDGTEILAQEKWRWLKSGLNIRAKKKSKHTHKKDEERQKCPAFTTYNWETESGEIEFVGYFFVSDPVYGFGDARIVSRGQGWAGCPVPSVTIKGRASKQADDVTET